MTNDNVGNYRLQIFNGLNDCIELNDLIDEEYFLFILFSIFNAHYLPWIKNNSTQYKQNFDDRLEAMLNNLEMAFPNIQRQKYIIELGKKYCVKIERKLKICIDSISYQETPIDTLPEIFNSTQFWLFINHNNYLSLNNDSMKLLEIKSKYGQSMTIPVNF